MYRIEIEKKAEKSLRSIEKNVRLRIIDAIEDLARIPRPDGCKKLTNRDGYRIRVGDYRIIYSIKDELLVVTIVRIGNRREIYR